MKTRNFFILCLLGATLLGACHRYDREAELEAIRKCSDTIEQMNYAVDNDLSNRMIDHYLHFVDHFPKDSLCGLFLYRTADLYGVQNEAERALGCMDRIIKDYPDFAEVSWCYFFRGNYLQALGKGDEATEAYREFIEKYPDHAMAADARIILDNNYAGLSDEEMFQKIMENASSENIAADVQESK